jgi:uncharacterized protein
MCCAGRAPPSKEVDGGALRQAPLSESPRLASPGVSGDGRASSWSVDPAEWGTFLCAMFDQWVRNDVGRVFVQFFDVALESWDTGNASLCIFSSTWCL